MKSWNKFYTVIAAAVLVMSFTACGKKDSNDNKSFSSGSMSTDGSVVTSSSVVGSTNLSMQLRNIQVFANNISAELSINGNYLPIRIQNSAWQGYQYVGQVAVAYAGACTDSTCQTAYISLLIGAPSNCYSTNGYSGGTCYDFKQFAVKRTGGQVSAMREWSLGQVSYGSPQAYSMQVIMQSL